MYNTYLAADELRDIRDTIRNRWVLMGDLNAGCSYLTKPQMQRVELRKDSRFNWLIGDDGDTTVAHDKCMYYYNIVTHLYRSLWSFHCHGCTHCTTRQGPCAKYQRFQLYQCLQFGSRNFQEGVWSLSHWNGFGVPIRNKQSANGCICKQEFCIFLMGWHAKNIFLQWQDNNKSTIKHW